MNYLILTNNDLVKEAFENSMLVDGDYLDLLYEVRNYIHKGHKLINYPLNASIRMIFSPVKSILITKEMVEIHEKSIIIIEESIENYKKTMGERKPDYENLKDYKIMDYELFLSAIDENKRFK